MLLIHAKWAEQSHPTCEQRLPPTKPANSCVTSLKERPPELDSKVAELAFW